MNKEQFLLQLGEKLASLPYSEVRRSLDFYKEIIDDRIEDGMTEEEAVTSLESIDVIAERIILDNTPLPTLVKARVHQEKQQRAQDPHKHSNSGWIILLLILGFPLWFALLATMGVVVLACYIVLWSLILTLFSIVLSLGLSALICLIAAFIVLPFNGLSTLACLGAGLLLAGLTLLSWFPAILGAKGLVFLTGKLGKALGRSIKSLFIRKERS